MQASDEFSMLKLQVDQFAAQNHLQSLAEAQMQQQHLAEAQIEQQHYLNG
jgi:hypothetical protein